MCCFEFLSLLFLWCWKAKGWVEGRDAGRENAVLWDGILA
uniref:Uncharacterized protein n=1 Tax=uncultured Desulfobacterium sp. TaxID=201089 RepID=E1YBH8_9BACT|nr:unknown protein [uncultured Desulfobacterium sp.]